jgi:glycosyltransferase involved in cell wall biosynthesis
MNMIKISVIVSTYNRPDALGLVLLALAAQDNLALPGNSRQFRFAKRQAEPVLAFEVIIADDGSTCATAELINQLQPQLPYPLQHLWQPDKGFRAAKARNRAIAAASGDYLIFLDGDCIPQTDFIIRHRRLAETGWFVAGNRVLLSKTFTAQVIEKSPLAFQTGGTLVVRPFNKRQLGNMSGLGGIWAYLRRDINRFLPLLRLPDSPLRKRHRQKWQGAKTCNLGAWHDDILKINGFDERFQGWGHEDAELVVRLLRSGVGRKEGRFAVPVLHLWHPDEDRSQEPENRQRLEQILNSTATVAQEGLESMSRQG